MARARLSKSGIDIAKEGYDIDTAGIENMTFSSAMVAMRLEMSGTTGVVDFSGYMSDEYRRAIVTYSTPFQRPPVVMVAGIRPDGTTDQSCIVSYASSDQNNRAWQRPLYEIVSKADSFELYVTKLSTFGTRPTNWRYFVFANTLDAS